MFAIAVNPLFTGVFGFFSCCAAFNAVPENLLLFRFCFTYTICELFNALEIPTTKQQGPWNKTPVVSILTNEKYKGDALLQKTITIDFLTGKRKINEGEVTQYYVSNAHDPIVSAEVFEMVQNALKYRKETGLRFSGFYPLGGRVFCSSCGSFFGHKILQRRRNGRLTRKEIWRCNSYYDGNAHPHSIKDSQMVDGLAAALQTAIDSNMDVVDLCWETMKAIHPRLQRPKYDKIIRSIYEDANRTRKNILFLHFLIDKVIVSDGLHLTFYLKDGTQIEYSDASEPGVRRVRATVPAPQSQCSGQ